MKREEKNALSRQRILDAAMVEFAAKGYDAASLNTVCAANDISKGIIYHHFKDKDEIYLLCMAKCFTELTSYIEAALKDIEGPIEKRLAEYFDTRLRFFAEQPDLLGIFLHAVLSPPAHLAAEIKEARRSFDALNISVLTGLLDSSPLREGISVPCVVEDFRMYMDFFNLRFRSVLAEAPSPEAALQKHEERCHRQIEILLHGVLGASNENR